MDFVAAVAQQRGDLGGKSERDVFLSESVRSDLAGVTAAVAGVQDDNAGVA